jgi:NitT/TauT family transport system substrate-binding protein
MHRRNFLQALAAASASSALLGITSVGQRAYAADNSAAAPTIIRLNLPGPGALPFLPLELIGPLGLDQAVGARLNLRYHISGVLGFEDMIAGNADFAAHGAAILPALAQKGLPGRAIVTMAGQSAALTMLVRADLAKSIRRMSDLKGRVIAATSGSGRGKTYTQMTGEALLARHGISSSQVRWVQAGQTEEGIRSVLESRSVDAVWCEEPFASRMVKQGIAKFIKIDRQSAALLNEIGHLRSVLSMPAVAAGNAQGNEPSAEQLQRTMLMVRMTQSALRWMRQHRPAEIAARLPQVETRGEVADVLARYPYLFSPDGRFSAHAINQAGKLLTQIGTLPRAEEMRTYIDPRWAGETA